MKKTRIILLTVLVISMVGSVLPLFANTEMTPNKWDVEKLDGTSTAEDIELTCWEPPECTPSDSQPSDYDDSYITQGGETVNHYVIDDTGSHGPYYQLPFTCIYHGLYGDIWIGLDDAFDWHDDGGTPDDFDDDVWYFSYPWTPDGIIIEDAGYPGDYYLPEGYVDVVTAQDLKEVLIEFDSNIHDKDTMYFGMYADRPGYLGDYKVQVFVFNIWDEFFFDPIGAGGFIEGYFWSAIANSLNTNAFHMDTYQWWRRQGGNPPMESLGVDYSYLSPHPWEYEGTFAHEFQHLIHNDVDPDEESWVDEGCATLAEYLCGYGFSPGHISEYLYWFWDTPLVVWEGYLADYGASFLWTFYMYEHYGFTKYHRCNRYNGLIWDLVHEQANGIAGWSAVLEAHGVRKSFDEIFQDWMIANYLDDTRYYRGIYGYYALDIPSADSAYLSIPIVMEQWTADYGSGLFPWHVSQYPHEGVNYPLYYSRNLPYTANYVEFSKHGSLKWLSVDFDGEDYTGAIPTSGEYNWYSDGTAWSYYKMGGTFDIPEGGATLNFQNFFSIEADWDYGYVEVHDLGPADVIVTETGSIDEWTTLPGLLTTTTLAHPQVNDYVPEGQFQPNDYFLAGKWNGFTADSYGTYLEEMDLTPFAGHSIELYFVYWTDGYSLGSGWYVDDISIPELGFSNGAEPDEEGWSALPNPPGLPVGAGWHANNFVYYNDFKVSFIEIVNIYTKKGDLKYSYYCIGAMNVDSDTEMGHYSTYLYDYGHVQKLSIMVVANQPGYEHTLSSAYSFYADIRHPHHWWC
ncbi:MAG: hypothetical protein ACFE9R_02350 [Candidatus Hermodarchaeota archaeon]